MDVVIYEGNQNSFVQVLILCATLVFMWVSYSELLLCCSSVGHSKNSNESLHAPGMNERAPILECCTDRTVVFHNFIEIKTELTLFLQVTVRMMISCLSKFGRTYQK